MKHPFEKMLWKALKESTPIDNKVLAGAEGLREKGYSEKELYEVLKNLQKGLIDETDIEIMDEAVEEFSRYI